MSDLPIETELIDGAQYTDGTYQGRWVAVRGKFYNAQYGYMEKGSAKTLYRLEQPEPLYVRVAEYQPATVEPTRLGAIVRAADGAIWIRVSRDYIAPWYSVQSRDHFGWRKVEQPATVLFAGVTL